jgi:hypothetical protein
MKDLVLKGTNIEVKEGDTIFDRSTCKTYKVSSLEIPNLMKLGIIDFKNSDTQRFIINPDNCIDVQDIYNTVDKKLEDAYDVMCDLGAAVVNDYYPQYINMCLKEIAILLDKKYPDHIKDAKEYWVYSWLTDSIVNVPKTDIATYKATALFRTKEDAEYALDIMRGDIDLVLYE